MKNRFFKIKAVFALILSTLYFLSCQKDLSADNLANEANFEGALALSTATTTIEHPGRALAANCFQCHGTNGYGWEHLAGESPSEIIEELNEMKLKNPRADIMNVHAKAYTTEEIQLIADFFSKQ